jgi:site-specific DNA-adenine methylase
MKYGITYQGSKNAISEKIIEVLPSGRRFVDLFGGGGAISHCAVLSGKWQKVLYNEYNPLLVDLMKKAINGDFRNEKRWISREDFSKLKEQDGYIKYCWSFSCAGNNYLYSKEIEPWKKALHYARVLGDTSLFAEFGIKTDGSRGDIQKNKEEYKRKCLERLQSLERLERLQSLERLERLQSLERLERLQSLERLERLEVKQGSYLDYVYEDGDIVYCDPPYEGTKNYDKKDFNHAEFYDWVASRPYKVYFSSYEISDKRFYKVWSEKKRKLMCGACSDKITEYLYCNQLERLTLFDLI